MATVCERCGNETMVHVMSMFNQDIICMACKERERQHPLYEQAVEADNAAIRGGNVNFAGIGKPGDL